MTALHKRYRLTDLFLAYYAKTWEGPLFCVIDDDDLKMWSLVQKYSQWTHCEYSNALLSDKWLACMDLASRHKDQFDAVMILGSDDFIDDVYKAHIYTSLHLTHREWGERFEDEEHDLPEMHIVPRYIHYFNALTSDLICRKHKRPGAGRVLTNAMLERLEWKPWRYGDRNIDGSMDQRLSQIYGGNVPYVFIEDEIGCILDVKTGEGIWSFEHLKTNNVTPRSPVFELDAEPYLRERFPIIANQLLEWNTQGET